MMTQKKKNFKKLGVRIPLPLVRRMQQLGDSVNWSAVAVSAFERRVNGGGTEPTALSGLVERLRAEKQGEDTGADGRAAGLPDDLGMTGEFGRGKEAGESWARLKAGWSWFQQLEAVRDVLPDLFLQGHVTGDGLLRLRPLLRDLFLLFRPANDWRGQVWLCSQFDSDPNLYPNPNASATIVHGFLLGALEVWDAVKDRV